MTEIYEKSVVTKEVTEKKYLYTRCDWCKNSLLPEKECDDDFPMVETDFELRITTLCYDTPRSKSYFIKDLCKDCIIKLVKTLQDLGVEIVSGSY